MCNTENYLLYELIVHIMRIKDISLENRPRERMEKQGASVLSDSELLAVILQKGTKEEIFFLKEIN